MKAKQILIAALSFLLVILSGCKGADKTPMPPSTGRPGEVVIILADDLYKGAVGDTLVHFLTQPEPALPGSAMEGAEAMFSTVHLPPSALNNMIRPSRNLVIIDVGSQYVQPDFKAYKDYWSSGQILIRINAADREQLMDLIVKNKTTIVETLREGEVNRQADYSIRYRNEELAAQLLRKHEIIASFPKGFEPRLDTGNFTWIHFDPADMTIGVLIWEYPYTDQSQLAYANLLSFTDQHLKPRVPGPSKGSYMALVLDFPVLTRNLTVNGNYAVELKGLWETEGDFMGGPFISWSYVDEKRSRIVTVFGYVYAPNKDKRDQVRKLEGILKTVDFPD
ncbi:MAG: DUF4837 family protein [Bacteroidota bacterium]